MERLKKDAIKCFQASTRSRSKISAAVTIYLARIAGDSPACVEIFLVPAIATVRPASGVDASPARATFRHKSESWSEQQPCRQMHHLIFLLLLLLPSSQ
mmetsp:Transcript_82882/g.165439  ORF Transcript_82882/g.165439 Transcript_82882/m.165439 type:complete len:99 (-) Transcript_82882:399-695(-)